MISTFEQIPPTPLYQRGARGDFARLTAQVSGIMANCPDSATPPSPPPTVGEGRGGFS